MWSSQSLSNPLNWRLSKMVDKKVGCLPVLEGMVVMGLVTAEALLSRLAEMMMADEHAVRATMAMPMKKR